MSHHNNDISVHFAMMSHHNNDISVHFAIMSHHNNDISVHFAIMSHYVLSTAADTAAALVSSRLDYANSVLYGSPSRCLTRLQHIQNSVARIVLQQPSLSSRDTLQQLHWLPIKWRIQLKLASLTTKSYTPILRHICLNASIPTFLLAPCDHPPPLTCTSLALISISVHARFLLQLQQPGILSLPLKPLILSENTLKPIFSSLLLIAPSASDSFY